MIETTTGRGTVRAYEPAGLPRINCGIHAGADGVEPDLFGFVCVGGSARGCHDFGDFELSRLPDVDVVTALRVTRHGDLDGY